MVRGRHFEVAPLSVSRNQEILFLRLPALHSSSQPPWRPAATGPGVSGAVTVLDSDLAALARATVKELADIEAVISSRDASGLAHGIIAFGAEEFVDLLQHDTLQHIERVIDGAR